MFLPGLFHGGPRRGTVCEFWSCHGARDGADLTAATKSRFYHVAID